MSSHKNHHSSFLQLSHRSTKIICKQNAFPWILLLTLNQLFPFWRRWWWRVRNAHIKDGNSQKSFETQSYPPRSRLANCSVWPGVVLASTCWMYRVIVWSCVWEQSAHRSALVNCQALRLVAWLRDYIGPGQANSECEFHAYCICYRRCLPKLGSFKKSRPMNGWENEHCICLKMLARSS